MTQYLLLPMQPTPNGRMHIGHGGGTYLRSDTVARYLRSRGHDVTVVSGSDAHENWVLAESMRIGLGPFDVCAKYHAEIAADLQSLGVSLDMWIDPLSAEHESGYRAIHEENLTNLRMSGAAVLEEERVPVSALSGEVLMGTWITGECPSCGADAGGSSCVKCGDHFQPEELVNLRSRLDDSPLSWKTVESWFARPLDVEAIADSIRSRGLRDVIAEPALRYLGSKGGRVRLSGSGGWGIKSTLISDSAVLMNSYFLYAAYGADLYRRTRKLNVSPMAPSSKVVTVAFFGSDNTTPGIVVPAVLSQGSRSRISAFDFTVVNGMLHYEGRKCSTSKRHGIWIFELLGSQLVSSDELRFALSHARLDFGSDDITLVQLADRVNFFRLSIAPKITDTLREVDFDNERVQLCSELSSALVRQDEMMSLSRLDIAGALEVFLNWFAARTAINPAEWLVGVSILAYPIAPDLSTNLWRAIGLAGIPSTTALYESLVLSNIGFEVKNLVAISVDDLAPFVHMGVSE